jgi:hypothetical protein
MFVAEGVAREASGPRFRSVLCHISVSTTTTIVCTFSVTVFGKADYALSNHDVKQAGGGVEKGVLEYMYIGLIKELTAQISHQTPNKTHHSEKQSLPYTTHF